jgi:hypothetical protein
MLLSPDCHVAPRSGDGRPPLAEIYAAFDRLGEAGWQAIDITSQAAPSGGQLPIRAWTSSKEAEAIDSILVAGIHGREPAGVVALAKFIPRLVELAAARSLLVMPLLNPWGYLHHVRYGPDGHSVSDSDHLLGRSSAPACPEAAAITDFVVEQARIRPGAHVLDLHEDPVYEAPDYTFDGFGSYLYFVGDRAFDHPTSRRVRECLQRSSLPLVRDGITRFGERLVEGAIVDSADGSVDELFARRLGCTPVITVENLLHAPDSPALGDRVAVYLDVLDAFFGICSGAHLDPPGSLRLARG